MNKYTQIWVVLMYCGGVYADLPNWYLQQTLQPSSNAEYIGYGEGKTPAEAKMQARADIAKSIKAHIQSNIVIETKRQSSSFQRSSSQKINEQTNMMLENVKRLKSSHANQRYYVALSYLDLPLVDKAIYFLGKKGICHSPSQHPYLNQTRLMQMFKKTAHCQPSMQIDYRDATWKIKIENRWFNLTDANYNLLFAEANSPSLKLHLSSKNRYHGEMFHLTVNSYKNGFLSLFQITPKGKVSVLVANYPIISGEKLTYPDLAEYDGIEAYLAKGITHSFDLNIALLCTKQQDFSLFEAMTDKITNNQSNSHFPDLLNSMTDCAVTSQRINIRR